MSSTVLLFKAVLLIIGMGAFYKSPCARASNEQLSRTPALR